MYRTYKINKLYTDTIENPSKHLIIGKRCTGKRNLIDKILKNHQKSPKNLKNITTQFIKKNNIEYSSGDINVNCVEFIENFVFGVCFTYEGYIDFYKKYPGLSIQTNLDNFSETLKNLIEKQSNDKKNNKVSPVFVILDQCFYMKGDWVMNEYFRYIMAYGRFLKINVLLVMQYSMSIPYEIKANIDYVYLGYENINRNKIKLYEHYGGMFPNLNTFCRVFEQLTTSENDDKHFMVIKQHVGTYEISDQVFWI